MLKKLHNEKELFLRTAEGDEDAFELLFGMYQAKLYDFAFRLLKSHDGATELVQETFLKIWMSRETLASIEQPESFMFIIIRNKAIDYLRKVAQDDKLRRHLWQQINVLRNSTEEDYFAKESNELVEEACQRLSPQKQTIFRMSRYQGLNHDQIASQLRISKNTVKNQLVSSLRFIREHIARHSEAMILLVCLFL